MSAERQMFDSQLGSHKTILVDLYKKKTKAVAKRESDRFKYLSGFKARFQSLVSSIMSAVFSNLSSGLGSSAVAVDMANEAQKTVQGYFAQLMTGIPMVTLQGGDVPGWGQNVVIMGGG